MKRKSKSQDGIFWSTSGTTMLFGNNVNEEEYICSQKDMEIITEYMNASVKILYDFHKEVDPEWDEEQFADWLKTKSKPEVYGLSRYLFELYALTEAETYNR